MLEFLLDPFFKPLLNLPQPWGIFIISFIATLLILLVYKFMSDQEAMKRLKQEAKDIQGRIKEIKEDPAKIMELQKGAMEKQMQLMRHSFKPMLLTFIPIIIIFGWLQVNMVYDPIMPGQEFNTTVELLEGSGGEITLIVPEGVELLEKGTKKIENEMASWRLKGKAGEYLLEYQYNDAEYTKDVLITSNGGYVDPTKRFKNNVVKSINIGQERVIVLNLFGWKLGWLGSYILFSIGLNLILRRMMGVE